jgi:hypothetical protein
VVSAADRLLATYGAEHKDKVVGLFDRLVKKVPAVLNQIDYTIGFRCEPIRVMRVLSMLGFGHKKQNDKMIFSDGRSTFELFEPREDTPVLRLIQ